MELPAGLLFYAFIGILVVLEIIALYMIYSYFKLLRSYDSIMKKQREMELALRERSEQLLKAAQQQAQTMIDQANTKAQAIVSQAEFFNQVTQDKVNEALQHFMQQELVTFQQLFEGVRQQTLKELQTMSQQVAAQASEQTGATSRAFGLAMTEAQKRAETQLNTAYATALEEVSTYKATRVKQLNQLTTNFVREAARRFFKKALTRDQQEALVMEALDEAQREKLF